MLCFCFPYPLPYHPAEHRCLLGDFKVRNDRGALDSKPYLADSGCGWAGDGRAMRKMTGSS